MPLSWDTQIANSCFGHSSDLDALDNLLSLRVPSIYLSLTLLLPRHASLDERVRKGRLHTSCVGLSKFVLWELGTPSSERRSDPINLTVEAPLITHFIFYLLVYFYFS